MSATPTSCPDCGGALDTAGQCCNSLCAVWRRDRSRPKGGAVGWVCPVCGRGLAPWTAACVCVSTYRLVDSGDVKGVVTGQ